MEIRGTKISEDEHGFLCLNDMWKLSGEEEWKSPRKWRAFLITKELLSALNSNVLYKDVWAKTPAKSAIYSRRGNQGGTFAHVILALAYAEYLSPELGIEVREIALRVYAGDVTVLDQYNKAKQKQLEDDHNRVTVRDEVRRNNYDLNMILKYIGATSVIHWSKFHDDGYIGLYDGLTENQIHSRKGLKRGQAILDHMNFHELAANMYRTSLTQQYLIEHNIDNVLRACEVNKRMGKDIRAQLKRYKLKMPEDHPSVENIRESYKRIRRLEKLRSKNK